MAAGGLEIERFDAREHQAILGARHPDIEQPPRLLEILLRRTPRRGASGKLRILDTEHVHARELQPLGGVQREQVDPAAIRIDAVGAGERDTLEKARYLV